MGQIADIKVYPKENKATEGFLKMIFNTLRKMKWEEIKYDIKNKQESIVGRQEWENTVPRIGLAMVTMDKNQMTSQCIRKKQLNNDFLKKFKIKSTENGSTSWPEEHGWFSG